MSKRHRLVLLSFFFAPAGFAALQWTQPNIELKAKPGESATIVSFHFRNAGDTPVRILSVEGSCGCMTNKFPSEPISAGKEGQIEMTMSFDGRTGRLTGFAEVKTSVAPDKPDRLSVAVEVPSFLEIEPRTLVWKKNESPGPKRAVMTVVAPEHTTVEGIECSNRSFRATIARTAKPNVYYVDVHASDTSETTSAIVRVRTVTHGVSKEALVFASVR